MLKKDQIAMPYPTRRWLTPDESAVYLGVCRRQFDKIVSDADIEPARCMGTQSPRYDVNDLDSMMEASKHGVSRDKAGQARQTA